MSKPCCICDPRVPNREGWHPYPSDCIDHLKAALAHERDRAKRVVRVFWRVRGIDGDGVPLLMNMRQRKDARSLRRSLGGELTVRRVVVRRKAK